nr:LysR family transcriptional regulator [Pseudomonas sp. 2FG]
MSGPIRIRLISKKDRSPVLVVLADAGNISRAAERVGITQSGASQAIAQLEALPGVQVFARDAADSVDSS